MIPYALRGSACVLQRLASRQHCVHGPLLSSAPPLSAPQLTAIRQLQTLVHRHNIIIQREGNIVRLLSASKKASTKRRVVSGKMSDNHLTLAGRKRRIRDGVLYCVGVILFMLGVTFASVPLYKLFCSATGYGGTTQHDKSEESGEKIEKMETVKWRPITVNFTTQVDKGLSWEFTPVQDSVELVPGETCLAFFTAKNLTDKPITGVSVYNVVPVDAGGYFNKIQCFCFDEQRLNAHEEIDMPVFFYIDPEFALDTGLMDRKVTQVTLNYVFFDTAGDKDDGRLVVWAKKLYRQILPEWLIGEDLEKYRPTADTDLRNPNNR